jgi:hypothetical protein
VLKNNRVLRGIYGSKREEVKGSWRRLPNKELHNLHTSPNIIREIKSRRKTWVQHVVHMREMRNACIVLVRNPEGKT